MNFWIEDHDSKRQVLPSLSKDLSGTVKILTETLAKGCSRCRSLEIQYKDGLMKAVDPVRTMQRTRFVRIARRLLMHWSALQQESLISFMPSQQFNIWRSSLWSALETQSQPELEAWRNNFRSRNGTSRNLVRSSFTPLARGRLGIQQSRDGCGLTALVTKDAMALKTLAEAGGSLFASGFLPLRLFMR